MIGNKVCFFQTIESTNTYMKTNIKAYKHGDMICAKIQTSGRGRRDRSWISKEGNLHTSFLLDTTVESYEPFEVVMRTSLAVVQMLKEYEIQSVIKYPNDVLVGKRKIAGILIEKVKDSYIVGVGVNVSFSDKDMYAFHPASILLETGRFIDYRDVLSGFINAYNQLLEYDVKQIHELYKGYSLVLDQVVHINEEEMLVLDITLQGELEVSVHGKTKRLSTNEVTLPEMYHEE